MGYSSTGKGGDKVVAENQSQELGHFKGGVFEEYSKKRKNCQYMFYSGLVPLQKRKPQGIRLQISSI